jgi:hypothetical protein
MKTLVLASLALGLALAPATGYASSAASNPLHNHRIAHHKVFAHRPVDSRAIAYAHPPVSPLFGMLANPSIVRDSSGHETDGLSRNADDCVRWGCIDNGGG